MQKRRARARDAIGEAQYPNPAAGKDVMQRRVVGRIRPIAAESRDIFKVGVDRLRAR